MIAAKHGGIFDKSGTPAERKRRGGWSIEGLKEFFTGKTGNVGCSDTGRGGSVEAGRTNDTVFGEVAPKAGGGGAWDTDGAVTVDIVDWIGVGLESLVGTLLMGINGGGNRIFNTGFVGEAGSSTLVEDGIEGSRLITMVSIGSTIVNGSSISGRVVVVVDGDGGEEFDRREVTEMDDIGDNGGSKAVSVGVFLAGFSEAGCWGATAGVSEVGCLDLSAGVAEVDCWDVLAGVSEVGCWDLLEDKRLERRVGAGGAFFFCLVAVRGFGSVSSSAGKMLGDSGIFCSTISPLSLRKSPARFK